MTPEEDALLVLQGHWIRIEEEQAVAILPLAEDGNDWAHQAICAFAEALTDNGEALPDAIQEYVVRRAMDGPPKRQRGGNEHDKFIRNITIVVAIKRLLKNYALSATRNETTEEVWPALSCRLRWSVSG